jgi:hypothetical protein
MYQHAAVSFKASSAIQFRIFCSSFTPSGASTIGAQNMLIYQSLAMLL